MTKKIVDVYCIYCNRDKYSIKLVCHPNLNHAITDFANRCDGRRYRKREIKVYKGKGFYRRRWRPVSTEIPQNSNSYFGFKELSKIGEQK